MPKLNNLKKLTDFDNKTLLIVDDDNPFRDRLARAMEKKGFEVFQAEGVQKGIQSVIFFKLFSSAMRLIWCLIIEFQHLLFTLH